MMGLLGLFSLLLFLGLSTLLHRHIDDELLTLANQESQQVELATGQFHISPHRSLEQHSEDDPEEFDDEEELRQAIRYSVILDANGRIVWSGQSTENRQPPSSHLLTQVQHGNTVFETLHPQGRPPFAAFPFLCPSKTTVSLFFKPNNLCNLCMTPSGGCSAC